jgi:serine/threonine protein phosphatase PrpC
MGPDHRPALMPGVRFASHALTHIGLVRRRNEDALLDRPDIGLWAVADGMGGHQAGDVASSCVVAALGELRPAAEPGAFAQLCVARLREIDAELRARALLLDPAAVIASTAVVLLAGETEYVCVWAGDSRIYRWRDGSLARLTKDHSRVQELVDAGELAPEAAARHPESNIVTQAIGAGRLEFGKIAGALLPGDRFLLCSDGLTNIMSDSEIAGELRESADLAGTATRLLDVVLARGAPDNVTIVVVAAEPAP